MRSVICAVLSIAAAVVLAAQPQTGTIVGVVRDTDGGVLPGARVVVAGAGREWTTLTNDQGQFIVSNLPAGTFRVTVRLSGPLGVTDDSVVVAAGIATNWFATMRWVSDRDQVPAVGFDPNHPALVRDIYEAVLAEIFPGQPPVRLVVQAETLPPPRVIHEEWPKNFAVVPDAVRAVMAQEAHRRAVLHHAGSFPATMRLVSHAEISRLLGPSTTKGWDGFRRRYGSVRYVALTRGFVTENQLGALVEYHSHCGDCETKGAALWLERADSLDRWRVVTRAFEWATVGG